MTSKTMVVHSPRFLGQPLCSRLVGQTILLLATTVCFGCGKSQGLQSTAIASGQQNYETGESAMAQSDFDLAEKSFTQALSLGGLTPDQVDEALHNRARARLQLGMLDEAEADLREAEMGAMDLARVYALWGDVMLERDDLAQARDKYAKARQLDSKIVLPGKLRK